MKKILLSFILLILFFSSQLFSQKPNSSNSLQKSNLVLYKDYIKFNINKISTHIYCNGDQDIMPDGNSGFEFPKGSGKPAVFESGLVFGGMVNGKKLVGGASYSQGLRPGRILEDGTPQDPDDPSARIYRVRPDFMYADLSSEINDEERPYQEILDQYEKDWNEWPGNIGAPYTDIDYNGSYDPNIDIPGVPGAHQTIWYVANDFDSAYSKSLYGSTPLYVEFQVTIWGYNIPSTIYENLMFKKYKIINKNNAEISPMFISQWTDVDIGDAGDDFAGCDPSMNLAFCYNGDDDDEGYYGPSPPAVGFQLIQGPIVEGSPTDEAFYDGRKLYGYKNLNITSHYFFIGGDPVYNDPDLGEYVTGTLQFWNLFNGLISTSGLPFISPVSKDTVVFTLDGDPLIGKGWIDGIIHAPGDRRNGFVSGPFNLAVGDTQEVVIAQSAALGTDRLNSLLLLKEQSAILLNEYENILEISSLDIYNSIYKLSTNLEQNEYNSYDIIELNFDRIDSLESYNNDGYEFQGYNIYQLGSHLYQSSAGHRIFTFDKKDDITEIFGEKYNPWSNLLTDSIIVKGTNSGIPNQIIIEKDYITNTDLIKGKEYIYGIAPYFFNRTENKLIEGKLSAAHIIFQEDLPGAAYLDIIESQRDIGTSSTMLDIQVVNPYELTGDTYEITFGYQNYYLDKDGEWKKTNYPDSIGKMNKPNDQSPSRLIPLPSVYAENQTLDIHLLVELNAPDFNWSDGIKLTFPDGININSAEPASDSRRFRPAILGQTITWGSPDTTHDGGFSGGEDLTINIDYAEPNFTIEYEIFDDGWSKFYLDATDDSTYYNLGNGIVHGHGFVTLSGEIGYQFKSVNYWDLWNKSQNLQLLNEIELIENRNFNYYWNHGYNYGEEYIIDGFKMKLAGSFEPPINYLKLDLKSPSGLTRLTTSPQRSEEYISITDYTVFAGVETSWAIENFGVGTDDSEQLEHDYELRFSGEFDDGSFIENQRVYSVINGGQMATCFRMVSRDGLADHPSNPNSGTAEPFLMRIPFEVWNVEDPDNEYQVNFAFRDRERDGTENPFWTWNLNSRMYGIVINSPYDSNQVIQIDDGPDNYNKDATWVLVFYCTNYHLNDTVKVEYFNPITYNDVYSFTTPEAPTDKISPNSYEIFQNYPNPFNPITRIRYFIPEDGLVNINIYNILGQKVLNLVNKEMKAGKYETEFNGSNLASGIYIYRINSGKFTETKKMLLLK